MAIAETSTTNDVTAVRGENTAAGDGVHGVSKQGRGVHAESDTNFGLRAGSRTRPGVRGSSVDSRGVEGSSTKAEGGVFDGKTFGAIGVSDQGVGVQG